MGLYITFNPQLITYYDLTRIRQIMKKLISIVTPFYNEQENTDEYYRQLKNLFEKEKKYNFEFVAVEHGSHDNTFAKLLKLNKKDKRLKIVQLSKNFGNADAGILAGLNYAAGDAAVIIMADLQEPPPLISDLLRNWEKGYEIVYGQVEKRADPSFTRKILSLTYYKILNYLTGNIFPSNVADFRLLDKSVYQTVINMPERNKYLRGVIAWTGFKQIGVPFKRAPRFAGTSKADYKTIFKVAANGIFSFSYMPLKLVTYLGILVSALSFLMIGVQITLFIIYGRGAPGITTIVTLFSFFFGILFLILGVIGEYLARIYDEVKGRPSFIVRETIGFGKK